MVLRDLVVVVVRLSATMDTALCVALVPLRMRD